MPILIMKDRTNNIVYIVQELHTSLFKVHFYQHFHYILQLVYQLIFFSTYNFYNLDILQHHRISAFTFTVTTIPNKPFITSSFINSFFPFTSTFIFILTLFIVANTCI